MNTEGSIIIDAPASTVWDVFVDVEHWADWTASVTRIVALDGPGIAVGKRFEIKQPRMPKVVWAVTEVEPGVSWTWRQKSPGATTLARHEVTTIDPGHTAVRQTIEQRGLIGVIVGALTRRMTRRYLELEGNGLKTRSEQVTRADAASA
ncbi:MAG TPA: SRPBCC family protein [Acidimicrobiales bacterium]|nr:SRPBCC family protein [Acidimicrobiales bacterium]